MSVFFNGRLLVTPTVATRIDDSAMASRGLTVANNLALIGRANGGEPRKVFRISSPAEARDVFKSGELVEAIEKAFSPSAETNAPQYVFAMRVQPATQARFVLPQDGKTAEVGALQSFGALDPTSQIVLDPGSVGVVEGYYKGFRILMTSGPAAGETNLITAYDHTTKAADLKYKWTNQPAVADTYEVVPAAICLESTDFGSHVDRVKAKVQDGTAAGTKYISTSFDEDEYLVDNLGATYFDIQYTGADAEALIELAADKITIKTGAVGASTELISCDLLINDTVSKVVDFFDSQADIEANIGDPAFVDYPTFGKFDYVAAVDIKTSVTEITANLQAMVDWINGLQEPHVTVHRPIESGVLPANMIYTYLFGGTAKTPTILDWQECFDVFQTEDVQCVVPLTSTEAVHAMTLTHCEYMSLNGDMERRCICGGALNETADQMIARAKKLNHDRCYLVGPGFKDYNDGGVLVNYPPYMAAAMLGGMITGSDPGTSLTNKTIRVAGLEQKFRQPADTDKLINGGVIAMVETKQGYKVVRSVSTWLANDNFNRVEMGTGFAVDYVARTVRNALAPLIGKKGTPAILGRAVSVTENALIELARPAPMGPEVITGDLASPPYKDITATIEGDILRVYFQCSPVVPVNYIPVAIAIVPYSGSASSALAA